jgi:septum formation protein
MPISKARLILGSGSPRRRELFSRFWHDSEYEIIVPEFNEPSFIDGWQHSPDCGSLGNLAASLANGKSEAIANNLDGRFVIVSADTLVVSGGKILGKPDDSASAEQMLRQLSGKKHQVITGLSLLASNNQTRRIWSDFVITEVVFRELSEAVIHWYVSSGEPLDKAGAYGIQGLGSVLVESINGCYYNVMGLPINRLMNMLQDAAFNSSEFEFICGLLPWN